MENKFSVNKILCSIAGAEPQILEQCQIERKKFGAIGAAIAMTSFIAFLSGTSAAWYFTQSEADPVGSIWWALAFGLVWATLIFCIDRSLVITMKKTPENKSASWWVVPLFSRAFLAMIIAFMVSIPLELYIFNGTIAENKVHWEEERKMELDSNSMATREATSAQNRMNEGNLDLNRLRDEKSRLDDTLRVKLHQLDEERAKLNKPTTEAYRKALNNWNSSNSKIASLKRELESANYNQKASFNEMISEEQARRNRYRSIMNYEIANWNRPIKETINSLEQEISETKGAISENENKSEEVNNRIDKYRAERDSAINEGRDVIGGYARTLKQSNLFIQNFQILNYAVAAKDVVCKSCKGLGHIKDDQLCYVCRGTGEVKGERPSEWYFLWLIRLLFFIVELMPTVVKIVMPIGVYERLVSAHEKNMESYIASFEYKNRIREMHQNEIEARKDRHEEQIQAEKAIRQKIIEDMKNAQLEVAEIAIKQWKENEMKKLLSEGKPVPSDNRKEI